MTTTSSPAVTKTWARAIAKPGVEFALTPLSILSGAIPAGLRGSLYRNGPARLERGGQKVGHWFDGDGAILGIHLTERGASGVYRYIQTKGYQAEEAAGKFLFGGYGMLPPGPVWERVSKGTKNAANTSVIALPDKLLALWEGGQPHSLDLQTLETFGLEDLGALAGGLPYSAHPKRDPKTGEIFNFGVLPGKNAVLKLYRSDASGKIVQQGSLELEGVPMIHDFVLAGPYLVFLIPPVRMSPLPVLARLKSYSDALTWQPEKGTQILVFERNTLTLISRGEAEPWYQWHFGNGYQEADGTLVIDFIRYEDFQSNQFFKEVATGITQTEAKGTLWQLRLDPKTGKILQIQEVCARTGEFPLVHPREVGRPSRYIYLSIRRSGTSIGQELLDAIGRFDYQTGTLTEANLGDHRYPMEPIYAPDLSNSDQGWILTVVFDVRNESSEVWIFDSEHLDQQPICRMALPTVIPFGFHGTWNPAKS
ncbi:MAG: carotenoid oxygenase family protein [Gloeobacterales cyanobacterium]